MIDDDDDEDKSTKIIVEMMIQSSAKVLNKFLYVDTIDIRT